jgi:hypothetical protein
MGKSREDLSAFAQYFLSNPQLSVCDPATRGIYMDLYLNMHLQDRCGVISGTRDELARVGRCSAVELVQAVDVLKSRGAATVTHRNERITVTDSQMHAEWKLRQANKERQVRFRNRHADTQDSAVCNGEKTQLSQPSVDDLSLLGGTRGAGKEGEKTLRSRVREFIKGHCALTWSWRIETEVIQLVERAGWDEAAKLIDLAVSKGANFPTSYAKKVLDGKLAKQAVATARPKTTPVGKFARRPYAAG